MHQKTAWLPRYGFPLMVLFVYGGALVYPRPDMSSIGIARMLIYVLMVATGAYLLGRAHGEQR